MGKVDRLHKRVEPFAALFWALSAMYLRTSGPACGPGFTPPPYIHKACPYMVRVGSILNEDAPAPTPFPI